MMSREELLTKTAQTFNTAADYFDAPPLSFWHRFGQKTIDRLLLNPGSRILDVCCGSGASAIVAAKSVGSTGYVLGIDIADGLLALARKKAQQEGLENIEFQVGDFEHLHLAKESFDAVVCVFGIFFVPDMVAALQELWRMIRPGGKLAITSWGANVFEPANGAFWDIMAEVRPDLVKKFTPWERISDSSSLQALLETAGATEVQVIAETYIHALDSPEDWWTMIMGGGLRGTIEQLDWATKKRVRQANLEFLENNGIGSLNVNVLYATATKQLPSNNLSLN